VVSLREPSFPIYRQLLGVIPDARERR
jgi:hypothetical protein